MSLKQKLIHFSSKFDRNSIDSAYPMEYCIPAYRAVSDENLPHLKHMMEYKSIQQFRQDLDYLLQHFEFVNWQEFKEFQHGKLRRRKIALLTFDDGLREFHDVIVPILEEKGVYALNFVNPAFVDNRDMMFRCKASLITDSILQSEAAAKTVAEALDLKNPPRKTLVKKISLINYLDRGTLDTLAEKIGISFADYLKKQQPYMSLQELKKLTAKGFGIASHSWDHPLYYELGAEEQLENTCRSLDYMTENGFTDDCFAFPFTDFGIKQDFFHQLFGSRNLFCSFGSAGIKYDDFGKNFQRIPMETGESAEEIMKDQISYFKLKRLFYKNKIRRN